MSASMRYPWIETEVEKKLADALKWLEADYHPGQILRKDGYVYDGDKLKIQFKGQKQVQIIEYRNEDNSSVHAIISDATTCIRASFAQQSTDAFEKKHLRKCPSLYDIIVIEDFYLTCNFKCRQSEALSLCIVAFKLMSPGTNKFGRPELVENKVDMFVLTTQFSDIFTKAQPNLDSPAKSQVGDFASEDQYLPGVRSQEEFSTQLQQVQKFNSRSKETAGQNKPREDEYLLSMLVKRKDKPIVRPPETVVNAQGKSPSRQSAILKPAPQEEIAKQTLRLEAKANSIISISPVSASVRALVHTVNDDILPDNRENKLEFVAPAPSTLAKDGEKENPQETSLRNEFVIDENPSKATKAAEQQCSSSFIYISPGDDSFIGLARIPRKHVQVPKDQQKLLDREDSWVTDTTTAIYKVPPQVVETTSLFVENIITGKTKTKRSQKSNASMSENGNYDDSDLEAITKSATADIRMSAKSKQKLSRDALELPSSSPIITDRIDGDDDENTLVFDAEDTTSEEATSFFTPSPDRGIKFLAQLPADNDDGSPKPQIEDDMEIDEDMERALDGHSTDLRAGFDPHVRNDGFTWENQRTTSLGPCSGNQTEDEEMELTFPHAIGDDIQEIDTEIEEASKTVQDIPSTAVSQQPQIVQVERTPYSNQNVARLSTDVHRKQKVQSTNSTELSSDPIIPGTFSDASSQKYSGNLGSLKLSTNLVPSTTANEAEPEYYSENQDFHRQASPHCESSQGNKESRHTPSMEAAPLNSGNRFHVNSEPRRRQLGSSRSSSGDHTPTKLKILDRSTEPPVRMSPLLDSFKTMHCKRKSAITIQENNDNPRNKRHRSIEQDSDHTGNDTMSISARFRARRLAFKEALSPEPDSEPAPLESTDLQRSPRTVDRLLDPRSSPHSNISPRSAKALSQDDLTNHPSDEQMESSVNMSLPQTGRPKTLTSDLSPDYVSAYVASLEERGLSQSNVKNKTRTEDASLSRKVAYESVTTTKGYKSYSSSSLSVFEKYKLAYPSFGGDQVLFIKACVYLEWLVNEDIEPHSFLWDDFIRVFATDFREYCHDCQAQEKNAIPMLQYYNKNVVDPKFLCRIVTTPKDIDEALCLDIDLVNRARARYEKNDAQLRQSSSFANQPPPIAPSCERRSLNKDLSGVAGIIHGDVIQGSKKDGTAVVPKKPFFETYSQLAATAARTHNEVPTTVATPENASFEPRTQLATTTIPTHKQVSKFEAINHNILPQKRRSLPWSETKSPSSLEVSVSNEPSQSNRASLLSTTAPLSRQRYPEKTPAFEVLQSKSHLRHSLGPPVLGSQGSSPSAQKIGAQGNALGISKSKRHKITSSPYSRNDNLDPVQGWLKDQPHPQKMIKQTVIEPPDPVTARRVRSFLKSTKDYVPRKKRLSGMSSTTSTPNSTPTLDSVVKTERAPEVTEPETQAWDF